MLFDGAIAATVAETAATTSDSTIDHAANDTTTTAQNNHDDSVVQATQNIDVTAVADGTASDRKEVAFIDTSVRDYQTLVAGIKPGVEVILINGDQDGLQQIAEWAATHTGYDAIHIFSHGSEGKLNLGTTLLTETALQSENVQAELAAIGNALTADGDLLLYGCDVAAGAHGDAFIAGLAAATGADVAASINATGSSVIGGDWVLEKTIGEVGSLALTVDSYQELLTVVTFSDADGDLDYTNTSITRTVDGHQITFSGGSGGGGLATDYSFGAEGLYALEAAVDSDTKLTITAPTGYTFDLTSLNAGALTGIVYFSVTYSSGSTITFNSHVSADGFSSITSFAFAINDVTEVVITSDDYSVLQDINITDIKSLSAPPVIGNLNGDSVTFTEGGSRVLLDAGSNATVTDTADFGVGSELRVSISVNRSSGDVLEIVNQGTGAGQIGIADSAISYAGTVIGSYTGGNGGSDLVVTFNANATPAAVQALVRALSYQNTNAADPSPLTRTVSVTLNDGDGATTAATVSVSVVAVNDAPVVVATGNSPTYTENGSAVDLFSGVSVSTVESGQTVTQFTLTVSNLTDGSSEILMVDGTSLILTNGNSGTTAANGMDYSISVIDGTATVTLSKSGGVSTSAAASMIDGMAYQNSSDNPTAANRVVTLTSITDNGGASNDGVDTASLAISSVVAVIAVNDAPTITLPAVINVNEDVTTPITGISFADVDSGNASVSVAFSVESGSLAAASGSGVIVAGSGTGQLTLVGSIADINAFIAASNVTFTTASNATGDVTLTVTIDDGGNTGIDPGSSGTDSSEAASSTLTLTVMAVNDAPVNSVPGAQNVAQGGILVFNSANGNLISVSDVDIGSNSMSITLLATHGVLTLSSVTGLTFLIGSGIGDATMMFIGSLSDINSALNGMYYTPTSGYTGSAAIVITSEDQGASGSGGAQMDTDAISVTVNPNHPYVTSVSSSTANGTYKIGDTIYVSVAFNSAVTVDTSGGVPMLLLETGVVDREASYVSGSGSNTLTFSYTVRSGDVSADLNYASTAALSLNGAVIRNNSSGLDAVLTLPALDGGSSLADQKDIFVDGVLPTATIVVAETALKAGETSLVTITFSEAVSGFTNADLTVASGTLSAVSSSDGGITWTAIFTPAANVTNAASLITLNNSGVTDVAGNTGTGTTDSNPFSIDTERPTATIVVADTALKAGETSLVTITFSEAVSDFTNADLTVANGTLSPVSSSDGGITWTAVLIPAANVTVAANLITMNNSGVTDVAGNTGIGTTNSGYFSIDTERPTATIVVADTALKAGETSLVTITFSEAVSDFTNADLTVANGTLSAVSSSDGGITWTAVFTPAANVTNTASLITLNNSGVTDVAGNTGTGTTDSNPYSIDTERPTATIVVAETALKAGETSLVTITFSEAVSGFTNADLTVANGTLSAVSSSDGGITWTAIFTPAANVTNAANLITLNNSGVTDVAGNTGTGTTDSGYFSIDTERPEPVSLTLDSTPAGQTLSYTLVFSESVTGVDISDFSLVSTGSATAAIGSVTALSSTTYRVDLVNVVGAGTVQLVFNSSNAGVMDNVGNQVNQSINAVYTNTAPVSSGIGNQTANEDDVFNFTLPPDAFTDSDAGETLTYRAELANGSALPDWLAFDAQTQTFSGTPENGDVGMLNIRVTVTDRNDVSVSSDFVLTVNNTNDAPETVGISDQRAIGGHSFSFQIPADTFTDVDVGDVLSLGATLSNGDALPAWLRFDPATGIFTGTPTNANRGDISIRVTAADLQGASVSAVFVLSVQRGVEPDGDPEFRSIGGRLKPVIPISNTGDQSQLSLLNQTDADSGGLLGAPSSLFNAPEPDDTTPGTSVIFSASAQGGRAVAPANIAMVFSNNGVNHYESGVVRGNADLNQTIEASSTLAGLFAGPSLPGNTALEIFSDGRWQNVSDANMASMVTPTSVFGAPVFSQQLKELDEYEYQRIASIEGALQNVKRPV
ncbi:Ig-like domain-containing protein [Brenneria roseae]|nr:Ig-like domain-containing protein [Brenneria roseae]